MNLNHLTFNQNQTIGNDMNMIIDTFLTYTIHDCTYQVKNVSSNLSHFENQNWFFFHWILKKTNTTTHLSYASSNALKNVIVNNNLKCHSADFSQCYVEILLYFIQLEANEKMDKCNKLTRTTGPLKKIAWGKPQITTTVKRSTVWMQQSERDVRVDWYELNTLLTFSLAEITE